MATAIVRREDVFPAGTSVAAYAASNWPQASLPPSGAPVGSAASTATVQTDGSVTLTGLADATAYYAAAQVSGVWRYVGFRTDVASSSGVSTPATRHASGRYYYPTTLPSAASALTINQLMAMPLAIGRAVTLDRICVNVGAAGTAGSVVRLGLYADDGTGNPGSLILDAGTADTASTGAKELVISQALSAGWVWLAGVAQVAVPQVARVQGMFWPFGFSASTVVNSALAAAFIHNGAVSGALPATFLPTTNNVGFLISVRVA